MKKIVHIIFIAILLISSISCQQQPNYQYVISDRAQRDTTLSYSGIYLGDSITKYGSTKETLIDVKDEYISLPDVNVGNNMTQIVGNVPTHISIEQHNGSGKIDAIVVNLEGDEYTLQSLIKKYTNLYGIYSYYEAVDGFPNYQKHHRVPNNDVLNAQEYILQDAMSTIQHIDISNAQFNFVWKWKNQSISIGCVVQNHISIALLNN